MESVVLYFLQGELGESITEPNAFVVSIYSVILMLSHL
jgi:hypothetical protein